MARHTRPLDKPSHPPGLLFAHDSRLKRWFLKCQSRTRLFVKSASVNFRRAYWLPLRREGETAFLAIINAPIVLWLLSAVALSFLPLLSQTRQQCLEKSSTLIIDQLRTQSEINQRIYYFKEAVLSAKTPKQLQEILSKRKVSLSDFRTKTLSDLFQDQGAILNYLSIEDRIKLAEQTVKSPTIIGLAFVAENGDIDDDAFNAIKKQVTEQTPWLSNATLFVSQCSIPSIIGLAVSGSHEFVRAILFDQP